MVRSKELSEALALRKKIVAAYESGKGFKKISKEFDISHSTIQENCLQVEDIQNNCHHAQVWPSKQSSHTESRPQDAKMHRDLQQALATVDVKVHDSTIRKRLHKFDFHGRCARRKPLLSKKNIKARLKFARENIDKDQVFWNNVHLDR
ncbi:hypothetical protein L3Q82_003131 [Scortum barcoo]|uniref:Uncharacterized protein n=1 Tax=Scortum barcoo TaxID=214431 RepID=A0ACB8VR36_9TELE|nr:hypothetical protein L3Q82_003131 [Scortum barcoo]